MLYPRLPRTLQHLVVRIAACALCTVGTVLAADDLEPALRDPSSGEPLATGSRRPTDEEWAWGESNLARLERIPVTPLGLARVNEHRGKHGKAPIDILFFEPDSTAGRDAAAPTSGGGTAPASLPAGVDNSTLKYFPPIRSQGSLNSCAQFSAVYYTLTHMTAMARDWDAKNGGDTFRFSPKWTYNMVNGGENVGSWHYDAYAIAQKHGLTTWSEFPYDSNYRAWCVDSTAWWNAIHRRAGQAGKITGLAGTTGLDQLKQMLVDGYVLNFATYINSWVWSTAANDPATPLDDAVAGKPCVTSVNGTAGGHAMTIVGYNDDLWVDFNANGIVDAGEKGALRIANSWGTGWNEAGYCWIAYKALQTRNPASTTEGLAWYDEATWVTAQASYTPRIVAQFTVNHAKRSQLSATLGLSATTASQPSTVWSPTRVLSSAGGSWAFNGTTTPISGTFYLDFSDIAPMTAGAQRYHLGLRDLTAGDPLTFTGFTLVDNIHGKAIPAPTPTASVDATQFYAAVDYDAVAGAIPPKAVAVASATQGNLPLIVDFDASASTDPDGTLVDFQWNFDDGTTGTGAAVRHTYTTAGTFVATVTVIDNDGARASTSIGIVSIDPNVVAAPSNLSGTAVSRVVTLSWSDNSNNETAFSIERGIKPKTGAIPYAVVGTTGANTRQFQETIAAGTYYYRVRALNASTGAYSPYSSAISLRVR